MSQQEDLFYANTLLIYSFRKNHIDNLALRTGTEAQRLHCRNGRRISDGISAAAHNHLERTRTGTSPLFLFRSWTRLDLAIQESWRDTHTASMPLYPPRPKKCKELDPDSKDLLGSRCQVFVDGFGEDGRGLVDGEGKEAT